MSPRTAAAMVAGRAGLPGLARACMAPGLAAKGSEEGARAGASVASIWPAMAWAAAAAAAAAAAVWSSLLRISQTRAGNYGGIAVLPAGAGTGTASRWAETFPPAAASACQGEASLAAATAAA